MSMWGGGVDPPRPPSVAPPKGPPPPVTDSSSGKRYARERQTELAALRQRGLAKLLNRHFTTVTKTIAEERAAAEAALRDLEMRKANTSEFVESMNDGLSYYEVQYKELHLKKAEIKRKERETLLLYQRYVDKFGSTGVVTVPSAREMKIGMPSIAGGPGLPLTPGRHQKDGKNSSSSNNKYLPDNMSPNSSAKVSQMAGEIEDELEKHVSAGADKLPSAETMGFEETIQSRRAEEERETAGFNKAALEAKGIDAIYSPSRTRNKDAAASQFGAVPDGVVSSSAGGGTATAASGKLSTSSLTPTATETTFGEEDDDDRSAVSGLTSTAMSETEARLIDFLKTETSNIRKMMEDEDSISNASGKVNNSVTSNSAVGTESANAANKAEAMVRQMQTMLSEHDPEKSQSLSIDHEPYELETPNPQETWVALWDDKHQREYYHETRSGLVQWEKPKCDEDDYALIADYTKSSRTHDLMLDDSHDSRNVNAGRRLSRRDVYRIKQRRLRKRRRILGIIFLVVTFGAAYYVYHRHQTDPVFAEHISRTIIDPAERLVGRVVGVERIKENVIYKTVVSYMPGIVTDEEKQRIRAEAEREIHAEIARSEKERLVKLEAERLAKEEQVRKETQEKAEKLKKEQARLAAEREKQAAAAQKKDEKKERDRLAKEAAGRKELERLAKEEADEKLNHRAGLKQKRREAEEAKRREIEERKKRALQRPWHCNLPLSYVMNSRCRKLSTANPVFDLRSLIESMMQ